MTKHTGTYPDNWPTLALAIKAYAEWRCVRCHHEHDTPAGYCLTVHHFDGNKANVKWWNLAALCQRCHLRIQGRVDIGRPWVFEHSEWFRPYAAGYYAWHYLGQDLTRPATMLRLAELLALESQAVIGREPVVLERTLRSVVGNGE